MRETAILFESYSMVRVRLQDERSPQFRLSDVVTGIMVIAALVSISATFLIDFRERN